MRVYPAGLRVTSKNLDPAPFWRAGSQICALNWQVRLPCPVPRPARVAHPIPQTHDLGRQLNDALFDGTGGWVLKPEHLRGTKRGDDPRSGKRKLEVVIFGAKGLPDISDVGPGKKMEPYVKVDLVSSQGRKRHTTKTFKPKKGDIGRNPVWGEGEKASFEWDDEWLVFLRCVVAERWAAER